jgi:hypothetical protein
MKKLILILLVLSQYGFAQRQKETFDEKYHFVCIQASDVYHDNAHCSSLQMCSGGKIRKTKNVHNLKPCKKCAAPRYHYLAAGFSDIKRVLGVKDKKQIVDSLGTAEGTIHRPGGFSIRITGPPDSRTVNMIEFYFIEPVEFIEDTLFSNQFYYRLGLQFQDCKADTIRSSTPHPVTGKVKKDVSIEYRGCAIVEARDSYEDTSKYYYELIFIGSERDFSTYLEKIQLILRVERP